MYVNIYACIISLHMDTNQVYNIYQLTVSHSSEIPQTKNLPPPPLQFNRFALENDGWKTILSGWGPVIFQGLLLLNFLRVNLPISVFPISWFPTTWHDLSSTCKKMGFQLPTCNLNWWTTPDFRDPSAQYLLRCRYGGLSLWHHRGHHGFRGQAVQNWGCQKVGFLWRFLGGWKTISWMVRGVWVDRSISH